MSLFDYAISQDITVNLEHVMVHHQYRDQDMAESASYNPRFFSGKDNEDPERFLDNLTAYCALRNGADPFEKYCHWP